jgi:hypothetical protein
MPHQLHDGGIKAVDAFKAQRNPKDFHIQNNNELCIAFLDLAKAFDTVSHKYLVAGLERYGTDKNFRDIVIRGSLNCV